MSNYNNDNNSAAPKADKHDGQSKSAADKGSLTHPTNSLGADSKKPANESCGEQQSPDKSVHAKSTN